MLGICLNKCNKYQLTGYNNDAVGTINISDGDQCSGVISVLSVAKKLYAQEIVSGAVDMTITTLQNFTIPHRMLAAPHVSKVNAFLSNTASYTHEEAFAFRVQYTDDTNIYCSYKLSVAGTGSTSIAWSASL